MISNNVVVIFVSFCFIFCDAQFIDRDYNTERIPEHVLIRQDSVPVIYVNGSHYEIGYMIGKTFGHFIQDSLSEHTSLARYLDIYKTSVRGREIYDECLRTVEYYFPQYLIELKGMADGAEISFHELFLVHLDDILTSNLQNAKSLGTKSSSTRCSTLMVNIPSRGQYIGHNEDAEKTRVNGFYVVSAHVYPEPEASGGVFEAGEEKWEAMTYAGLLPGHASGHNHHGLAYTINSVSSEKPYNKKIPRLFLTRALLATKADINEIQKTLTNQGAGTADAFHVNAGFVEESRYSRILYSIDVTPSKTQALSNVVIQSLESGSTSFYTNKLQYSEIDGLKKTIWNGSSGARKTFVESTFSKPIESLDDLLDVLGAIDDENWEILKNSGDNSINTLNIGVFDFIGRTWTLWTNNPRTNPAIIQFPLKFTTFASPGAPIRKDIGERPFYTKIMSEVSDMYKLGRKTLLEFLN